MKTLIAFLTVAALALPTFAAPGDAALQARAVIVARGKFVADHSRKFRGRNYYPAEAMEAKDRFDQNPEKANYVAVMMLADDDRLMFVRFVAENGKFLEGELDVFGFEPIKLTAADFEDLRRRRAMAVVNVDEKGMVVPIVFYTCLGKEFAYPQYRVYGYSFDPFAHLYGSLLPTLRERFGLKNSRLACEVTLKGPDGLEGSYGIVQGALGEGALFKGVRQFANDRAAKAKDVPKGKFVFTDGMEVVKKGEVTEVPRVIFANKSDFDAGLEQKDGKTITNVAAVARHFNQRREEWKKLRDLATANQLGDAPTQQYLSDSEVIELFIKSTLYVRPCAIPKAPK